MRPIRYLQTLILGIAWVAAPAFAGGEVTKMHVKPSATVWQGDVVTVVLEGTGSCRALIFAKGALGVKNKDTNDIGHVEIIPPKEGAVTPLPIIWTFEANIPGNFNLAAMVFEEGGGYCDAPGNHNTISTWLFVKDPNDPNKHRDKSPPITKPKVPYPEPGPPRPARTPVERGRKEAEASRTETTRKAEKSSSEKTSGEAAPPMPR